MAQNLKLILTDQYYDIVKRADGNGLNQIVIKYLLVSDAKGTASHKDTKIDGTTYKINVDSAKYQGESIISLTALDQLDSREYEVNSIGVFTDHDKMIAVCKVEKGGSPIANKTAKADLYLSIDLLIKEGNPRDVTVQGVPWHPALATHTSPGVIRIATEQEALEEKLNDAAITPIVFKTIHDKIKQEVHAEVVKMQKLIEQFKGSLCQPGHIQFWFSKAPIPEHWFDCDGKAFPAKYKELLKLYPNGKTPNFEGRYPRHSVNQAGTFLAQEIQKHNHGGKVHDAGGYNVNTSTFNYGTKGTSGATLNKRFWTNTAGNHKHDSGVYIRDFWERWSPYGNNIHKWTGGHSTAAHHEGRGRATPWTNTTGNHNHFVDVNFGGHSHTVAIGAHSHSVAIRAHGHGLTINYSGGAETRPNSFVGRFIIFGGIPS